MYRPTDWRRPRTSLQSRNLTIAAAIAVLHCGTLPSTVTAEVWHVPVPFDDWDGQEIDRTDWITHGLPEFQDGLGLGFSSSGQRTEPAFLFPLEELARHDEIAYARLKIASLGGDASSLALRIRGHFLCDGSPFDSENRPSQVPSTDLVVSWDQTDLWIFGDANDPMYLMTENIAGIVNEILASSCWPVAAGNGALAISMEVLGAGNGHRALPDFSQEWPSVELEVYPTVADAFLGAPLLSRPTNTTVDLSFTNLLSLDGYVAFGLAPGEYTWAQGSLPSILPAVNPLIATAAGVTRTIRLSGLEPDTRYYCALFYRENGSSEYVSTQEFDFHSTRATGAPFRFALLSDSHLEDRFDAGLLDDLELNQITLSNLRTDEPDLLLHLGDLAVIQDVHLGVRSSEEARRIYLDARSTLAAAGISIPYFQVIGNHEGELGWLDDGSETGPFYWGTLARKEIFPNPEPGSFYSGNPESDPRFGLAQNYYSWEWGDALFVVLDPFRNTTTRPHRYGGVGSDDGWDWTLGLEQYNWLHTLLTESDRTWKFLFTHHLSGGVIDPVFGPYGRGGIEGVRHQVAGRPSFEWGGEDFDGSDAYADKRPDFDHGDIHSLLIETGVDIVFHGHDHLFAHQEIDGIVYQECPMPSDSNYSAGFRGSGGYTEGATLPNSGHVRVDVSPQTVTVEYIRSYLPGEGENGEIAYSYYLGTASEATDSAPLVVDPQWVQFSPIPCRGSVRVLAKRALDLPVEIELFDTSGRIRSHFSATELESGHPLTWELRDPNGRGLPNGFYLARVRQGSHIEVHEIVVAR